MIVEESTMDSDLVSNVLKKVNYPALVAAIADIRSFQGDQSVTAALSLNVTGIPSEPPEEWGSIDESTLKAFHFFLFDVHVLEGILVCPDTGRKFPVKDGIPNMILHEDEV